jgi:hypothetical protein
MTARCDHFSWNAIEAHLEEPLDQRDREMLRDTGNSLGVWRVTESGLQDCKELTRLQ